jgi:hypothetical protein
MLKELYPIESDEEMLDGCGDCPHPIISEEVRRRWEGGLTTRGQRASRGKTARYPHTMKLGA